MSELAVAGYTVKRKDSMRKNSGNESAVTKEAETQPGCATACLTWLHRVVVSAFGGLGRAHGERRMELLDTLQLGGKRQLMLVLCDGQRYLVGAGNDSVHSIAEMASQQTSSPETSTPRERLLQVQTEIALPSAQREVGWSH